jgi:hypothetical protein
VSALESEQAFTETRSAWRTALRGHALAPPDAGFSARLAELAAAARGRAEACEAAHRDGFEWPPARGGASPPYELRPGTGRRGPEKLWARFDEAVAELDRVSEGRSLRAVAHAYTELAEIAAALAAAVEREDRGSGLLAAPARTGRRQGRRRASAKR